MRGEHATGDAFRFVHACYSLPIDFRSPRGPRAPWRGIRVVRAAEELHRHQVLVGVILPSLRLGDLLHHVHVELLFALADARGRHHAARRTRDDVVAHFLHRRHVLERGDAVIREHRKRHELPGLDIAEELVGIAERDVDVAAENRGVHFPAALERDVVQLDLRRVLRSSRSRLASEPAAPVPPTFTEPGVFFQAASMTCCIVL